MSKTQETIQEMARLTMLTNQLNDVQIQNLKTFPFVFFDGLNRVTMEYDLSNQLGADTVENTDDGEIEYNVTPTTTSHLHVTYRLVIDPIFTPNNLPQRFSALEQSVRSILWKEIKVVVFFGNQKVYESPNDQ